MLKIQIHGLSNGTRAYSLDVEAQKVPFITDEFTGLISFEGDVTKQNSTFVVQGTARCNATLICDRSGDSFEEPITAEIKLVYQVNPEMAELQEPDAPPPLYLFNNYEDIDITEEIRQELLVQLPMRRIAPEYRDLPLEEVIPGITVEEEQTKPQSSPQSEEQEDQEIDPRWQALKKIQFNSNDN